MLSKRLATSAKHRAMRKESKPPIIRAMIDAGPISPAALPGRRKIPCPMTPLIPRATTAVRVRLRFSPEPSDDGPVWLVETAVLGVSDESIGVF